MMKIELLIVLSLLILIIVYMVHYYIYSIYEITAFAEPDTISSDNESTTRICVKPINSFGKIVPLRSISVNFNITEGENLISVEYKNNKKGFVILRAKDKPGLVKIEIISNYSLLPNIVEIIIT